MNTSRTPRSSRPIKASHEPGVRGVTRAKSPMMMRITPITFLMITFIFARTIINSSELTVKVIANRHRCHYKWRDELSSCDFEKAVS